jgi:glycosyltransferase involved in cell wall biosynthesis
MAIHRARILHIAPFLWSGAGQVITSLCESQASRHDVAIVTSGRSGDQRDWPAYRRRLERLGAPHTRIDFFRRDPETFWQGVEALRRLVTRWRPTIVHAHAGVPACAAAALRGAGADFTLVNHLYSWGIGRPTWMNAMDLAGHRQADVVICSADAYERHLRDGGVARHRVVKLPWGLAPATIAVNEERPSRPREGRDANRIGLIGRIEPRKGQLALVKGFALLRRQLPGTTVDLVGPVADEAYAALIRREIDARRLRGVVRLRGRVRSVPAVLSGWDLCVSLSSDEGQGLAILEAMALGIPVAARPVAGVEDYFRPGVNGTGIRSARPTDVASALASALSNPRRRARMAMRGRQQVLRRYSWDRTIAAIERVYARAEAVRGGK